MSFFRYLFISFVIALFLYLIINLFLFLYFVIYSLSFFFVLYFFLYLFLYFFMYFVSSLCRSFPLCYSFRSLRCFIDFLPFLILLIVLRFLLSGSVVRYFLSFRCYFVPLCPFLPFLCSLVSIDLIACIYDMPLFPDIGFYYTLFSFLFTVCHFCSF